MPESLPTTILIVDDDESIRNLLKLILESAGIQAICAANANEALAALGDRECHIHGILLDLNLNQLKGEDFYDDIVAIDPNIAIFPMSGCLSEEIQERFANKRIAGLITKPFLPADIKRTILEGLSRQSSEG
jgi:two-component system, cell cycle sensor histidine kinase and response regulator CckA